MYFEDEELFYVFVQLFDGFSDLEIDVLILGVGNVVIFFVVCFKVVGVFYIMVEKNVKVGDNWVL